MPSANVVNARLRRDARNALEHAGARPPAARECAVVVVRDGLVRGDARQNGFARSRETREEVRLDEALGDEQVGLRGDGVDLAGAAGWQRSDLHHGVLIGRYIL